MAVGKTTYKATCLPRWSVGQTTGENQTYPERAALMRRWVLGASTFCKGACFVAKGLWLSRPAKL